MATDIFTTDKKYQIIYADPPWRYEDKNCEGAAEAQYSTMSLQDICNLPINRLADKDCVLFMWATYPKLKEALAVIEAWGFKYKTIAFQWIKLRKNAENLLFISEKDYFFGLGRWTRGNTECCLLATRGKPHRISASVSQLILSPLRRHSEKPAEARDKILELMGNDNNRIELFARQTVEGWDCWGNEV